MLKLPKTDFSTMWVGAPLSRLEILSLKSMLYHGYSVAIYLYDMNMEVPDGAVKVNANFVIPESNAFLAQGSYSIFSDLFRYKMLSSVDTTWVDLDCICLSDRFPLHEKYFFAKENYDGLINGAVLKYPRGSELDKFFIVESARLDAKNQYETNPGTMWAITGPHLVTRAVKELGLHEYEYPHTSVYPVYYNDLHYFFEPQFRDEFFRKISASLMAHCSNTVTTLKGDKKYDKNVFFEGSAIHELEQKFK